jgi:hypothetical protein
MKIQWLVLGLSSLPIMGFADTIDLKTGAWAVDAETQTSGVTIPKNVLDQMQPEQRTKLEESMRARNGKPVKHTFHTCVTQQDLQNSAVFDSDNDDSKCTRKVIAQTARSFQAEEVCPAPEASKGQVKIESKSPTDYSGTLERTLADGGKIVSKLNGHWVSATCTAADDD